MGTFTGAATCLCACTCFFHFSSFCKRCLVHILETKSFPFVLVKGLFKNKR